ncbi:MAG: hypothetical protein HQL54_01335 [Magnetococcales bacterium]|nr:hypothetical protein [Magnetococcales bacterium]
MTEKETASQKTDPKKKSATPMKPEGPKRPELYALINPGGSLDDEILDPANPNLITRPDK